MDHTNYRLPAPFDHVEVRTGPVDTDVTGLADLGSFHVGDGIVVHRNPSLAIAVHGTELVELEVAPHTDPAFVQASLYGLAMRLLFLHQGIFVLHASLLGFVDGATPHGVAVAGHSGAGKSTTVSYAARALGARLLVDDVVAVTVDGGVASAHPFERPVHLLPDAAERVGAGTDWDIHCGADGEEKYVASLAVGGKPVVLSHLISLELAAPDATDRLVTRKLTGAEKFRHIVRNSNVTGVSSHGGRSGPYFEWASALSSALDMAAVIRRPGEDTLDEVVEVINQSLVPEV